LPSLLSCVYNQSMSVYFGGSRNFKQVFTHLSSVVNAVVASGQSVHVGCQYGADQAVIHCACQLGAATALHVFAVAPNPWQAPQHIQNLYYSKIRIMFGAGGAAAPMPARYLLRSIAAFQGCSSAVFFAPGAGSLAVARECVRSGLPVFAFGAQPARASTVSGQWVESSFMGFQCWQWSAPIQISLF